MCDSGCFALPGDKICLLDENTSPGKGTYAREGAAWSTIAGIVSFEADPSDRMKRTVHVCIPGTSPNAVDYIPEVGDVVTCKVIAIGATAARVLIHCVAERVLRHPFKGIIQKENVRSIDRDNVLIGKSIRPNDVVLARVFGIGDGGAYLLTTAEPELGVVSAYSEAGVQMVPTSWTEMTCPMSGIKQERKIAKVFLNDESLDKK